MARSRRRIADAPVPDRITIPDLEGAIVAAALRHAELAGFTLVIADPPADLETLRSSGRWVVASQEPRGGSVRFRDDTVVVTLRRDGGGWAGDREPRNPLPLRSTGHGRTDLDRTLDSILPPGGAEDLAGMPDVSPYVRDEDGDRSDDGRQDRPRHLRSV